MWAALGSCLALGCVPPQVDLENRECPCAAGWTCDEARDRCVRSGTLDAGSGDAGNAMDAGADAATEDAGGLDPTACDDTLADSLVCDGFETPSGPWTETVNENGSTGFDSTHVFRGALSLRVQTASTEARVLRIAPFGPFSSGELWGRMMLYVPASSDIDLVAPMVIRDESEESAVVLAVNSASFQSFEGGPGIIRDEWNCVELHVEIEEDGRIEVFVRGQLNGEATATQPIDGFSELAIGLDFASDAQGATSYWIDEVALSRSRLPCD